MVHVIRVLNIEEWQRKREPTKAVHHISKESSEERFTLSSLNQG